MYRIISLVFLITIAMFTGHAQVMRSGAKVVRSIRRTAAASDKAVRNLKQQSQRASQASHVAESGSRIKLKTSSAPIVIPNLDSDDKTRKNNGKESGIIRSINPLIPNFTIAKIKFPGEMEDDQIVANYETIKSSATGGKFDNWPLELFKYADFAKRHNDEAFAILCIERINSEQVTPKLLEFVTRRFPALKEYMPEISRSIAIYAYSKMLEAKLKDVDCASARMQSGDTLLVITGQYNPTLNPLVELSCFYDPSKEMELYKKTADSVIATYNQWSDAFKDSFARDFAITLMDKREYATVLDYFGREPLKQFPDTQIDFVLDMVSCAIATKKDSLAYSYLEQAHSLDSVAANNYWSQLYDGNWKQFIENPSQTELADWLLETAPMPANNALVLSFDLLERISDPNDTSWEWEDISADTPEEATVRQAILYILDKGTALDEERSVPVMTSWSQFIKAEMLLADPAKLDEAKEILNSLADTDDLELRCKVIISQAYVAAHGLDSTNEGLKILKKNIKLLDDPSVTAEVREMWYDYMATLAIRIGKTKDASKYLKLKETTND